MTSARRVLQIAATVLSVSVLCGVADPSVSGASAAGSTPQQRGYRLPTVQWKSPPAQTEEIVGGAFEAYLTTSGPCAFIGRGTVLWPKGYRVRFKPTELLNPSGKVVARQGQLIAAKAWIVGTASWPSASRCDTGGSVYAIDGPLLTGRQVPNLAESA